MRIFRQIKFKTRNMKNSILTIIKIFSIICITILLNSCSNSNKVNEYDQLLSGKHELRKFNVKTTTKTETFGCMSLLKLAPMNQKQ